MRDRSARAGVQSIGGPEVLASLSAPPPTFVPKMAAPVMVIGGGVLPYGAVGKGLSTDQERARLKLEVTAALPPPAALACHCCHAWRPGADL